jgi:hypothetical protein
MTQAWQGSSSRCVQLQGTQPRHPKQTILKTNRNSMHRTLFSSIQNFLATNSAGCRSSKVARRWTVWNRYDHPTQQLRTPKPSLHCPQLLTRMRRPHLWTPKPESACQPCYSLTLASRPFSTASSRASPLHAYVPREPNVPRLNRLTRPRTLQDSSKSALLSRRSMPKA